MVPVEVSLRCLRLTAAQIQWISLTMDLEIAFGNSNYCGLLFQLTRCPLSGQPTFSRIMA